MEFSVSNRRWLPKKEQLLSDNTTTTATTLTAPNNPTADPLSTTPPSSSSSNTSKFSAPPKDFVVGLHVPGRYDKILPIDECWLQHPIANDILRFLTRKSQELELEPYDVKVQAGFLRSFFIRKGTLENGQVQFMVNIVTKDEHPERLKHLVEELVEEFPLHVTTVLNNITDKVGGPSVGLKEIVLHGTGHIREKLGDLSFDVSANSFFQPNSEQAAVLYDIIHTSCELAGNEVVYDLYCGTGSIGLTLARSAKVVYGIEIVESAVENARANAAHNGVDNAHFFQGDLATFLRSEESSTLLPRPDVLVVDPPRPGLAPKLVTDIIRLAPKRIIYTSCNPSTQVRDVRALCDNGYALTRIQPVDQFPHTSHVENVCTLELVGTGLIDQEQEQHPISPPPPLPL